MPYSPSSTTVKPLVSLGLSPESLASRDVIRAALAFQGDAQPPCRVLPKLKEFGYDIIGPVPVGDSLADLLQREKPDVLNLRIDEPDDEDTMAWISRVWADRRLPTVVVTMSDDSRVYAESAMAGAFAVVREDAPTEVIRSAFQMAAQRGGALREARERVAQLEANLANRRLVEQAKWILVQRDGMTEPEAHTALQATARNARVPLADVAQRVIDGGAL